MNFYKTIFTYLILLLVLSRLSAQDTIAIKYGKLITGESIKKHLTILAADSLEGRETAQPGMFKAADYVSKQFMSMGLPGVNGGSYYQQIPLLNFSNVTSEVNINNQNFIQSNDYFISEAPASVELNTAELFFAGFGITDSISGWDDYKNADVAGKIIIILEGEPTGKKIKSLITNSDTESIWKTDRSKKINLAKGKNPKAVFFIADDYAKLASRYAKRLESGRLGLDSKENNQLIPVIYISEKTGDALLKKAGKTIPGIKKQINKKRKPASRMIQADTRVKITIPKVFCNNVLGYIEGSELKNEVIIISAHLDHLGKRGDKIYYGADDDGSGSSSIISMAETFIKAKREGHQLKRSILFIAFTGEEKGLLGSEYYTTYPLFPLANTIANLNIDMIGRVDTVSRPSNYTYLIGSDKLSSQLHTINEAANNDCCKLSLDYKYNDPSDKLKLYYRSDHYNFAKNKIPVIFYFTGLHDDYHKPTDTIDKIDFEKTAGIARLVFNTAWQLANRKDRIVVDVVNDFK